MPAVSEPFTKCKRGAWRVAGTNVKVRDVWWSWRYRASMREMRKMYAKVADKLEQIILFAKAHESEMWDEVRSGI